MFSKLKNRYIVLFAVMSIMFAVLLLWFFFLMGASKESEENDTMQTSVKKSVSVEGMRGSILDSNGTPLAYDMSSYNVQFLQDKTKSASSDKAKYTQVFSDTIALIEENGGETIDTFLIVKDQDGTFKFDLDDLSEKNRASRIERWCENMYIEDVDATPEEMYHELRTRYRIPESMSFEDASKILSIWQEVQFGAYKSYVPITIAYNVSYNTVLKIEMYANELLGMSIQESSMRVYPKSDTAAHIIGYLGKITSEDDVETYEDKGYDIDNDFVGKSGVEATMEEYLTASSNERRGERILSVNSITGEVTEELSYSNPSNGDNVYLTIDLKAQEVLEKALKNNIESVYEEEVALYEKNKEEYDEKIKNREDPKVNMCISGAAAVMEVDTGKILAMASYPSYDLNLFVNGISDEDYQALLDNEAAPLFNNAVSSVSTPGSIYKVVTAVAGLMEGVITPTEVINDEGPYDKYIKSGHVPKCWVQPHYSTHANNQTVVEALKVSCNYFFYEVADRLGIDKINEWANNFGLTSKTNIELTGEAKGRVGNQSVLYDCTKDINDQYSYTPLLIYNKIYSLLEGYGTQRDVEYTDDMLNRATDRIVRLAGSVDGKNDYGEEIREIMLDELDIPKMVATVKGWSLEINQYLTELIWTPTDTVNQGIGVTPTQLTPIAVVRYVAAIANGGKILEPHVVDHVTDASGNVVMQQDTVVVNDINIPEEILDIVHEGMREVVSLEDGGTAGKQFKNFEYRDKLVGKTGTGKVSDVDIENNGWFICFAPFGEDEQPEIAIVVFLPHGLSGSNAIPTARDFLQYYFDAQKEQEEPSTPQEGELA